MKQLIATLSRIWHAFRHGADAVVDSFNPEGFVEARLIWADGPKKGEVYKVVKGHNVVTSWLSGTAPTSGRDLMRRLLVPSGTSGSLNGVVDASVSRIQLGSGSTAETVTDTGLDVPIVGSTKTFTSVEFDLSNPWVTFVFDYDKTEVNVSISEAILLTGATRSDVVARKTFGAFTKTSDFVLQLRWTIRY
jgi:hypothetical protein